MSKTTPKDPLTGRDLSTLSRDELVGLLAVIDYHLSLKKEEKGGEQ